MAVQFHFENHTLDAEKRELRRGTDLIAVEPQVFDLLLYLVQNRERVVSKDDLIAAVWGGRIVSDSTLDSRINAVRRAVGDNGDEQRLIRTVARKGVRFVCTVDEPEVAVAKAKAATAAKSAKISTAGTAKGSFLHRCRRRTHRLRGGRARTADGEDRELAQSPGIRLGKSDLEPSAA